MAQRAENSLEASSGNRDRASALTKTVLYPRHDGRCSVVVVPFDWFANRPLPAGTSQLVFPSVDAAMAALARRGRLAGNLPLAPEIDLPNFS